MTMLICNNCAPSLRCLCLCTPNTNIACHGMAQLHLATATAYTTAVTYQKLYCTLYGHPAKDNTKYKGESSRFCVNYEAVPSTNKKHIHYIHCRRKFRNSKEKHTGTHVSNLLRPLLLHALLMYYQ